MRFFTSSLAGFLTLAVAALGATTISSNAMPAGCNGSSPYTASTFTLTSATAMCTHSGNDTNQIDSAFEMFGLTGWKLSDKNDDGAAGNPITFTDAPDNGTKSGDWSIDTLAGLTNVVITLKAGNGFGAFLLDLTVADPLTGTWSSTKGLSHASIYYNGTPAVVPLPAGAVLLLTGLAGLGFAARRRMKG